MHWQLAINYLFLTCTSGERKQRDIPRLLDCRTQAALVRRAHARQTARHDLAAFGDKLRQQAHILVIDRLDFLRAELANLLAAEILPSAGPAFTTATGSGARRTSLGMCWCLGRCCRGCSFVSHDSPSKSFCCSCLAIGPRPVRRPACLTTNDQRSND